jgi:hypothetical protein
MPHDKEYYLTSQIPYKYEPGKECPEPFRQFVADSFGEDMLDVIRAFTSMFLDQQHLTENSLTSSVRVAVAKVLWDDSGIPYLARMVLVLGISQISLRQREGINILQGSHF